MSDVVLKKSAFETDAILFTVIGIGIGAFLNYLIRKSADAKLEAKIHDEIEALKENKCSDEKSNVVGATPPAPYSTSNPMIGGVSKNIGDFSGTSIYATGRAYGGIPTTALNCLTRDSSGNVLFAPCGGDFDLTI